MKDFIQKAEHIHGYKYDYSNVNYINSLTKIKIVCPKHGEFWQTPSKHIYCGQGCPECGKIKSLVTRKNKYNKETFIKKANEIHNYKYDYSKFKYVNSKSKVIIICPEHGEFEQIVNSHLNGKGCLKCSLNRKHMRSNSMEFIQKANKIHANFYNYSKVDYIKSNKKVEIICPVHGSFWQTPNNHLRFRQCPKCSIEKVAKKRTLKHDEFVRKAKEIHGDKYDYSNCKYQKTRLKIKIRCPKHGNFLQIPNSHLRGRGCPKCYGNSSKKEKLWLDLNKISYENRQYIIKWIDVDNKNRHYKVDGFDPKTNTVYEFLGDYWHSNIECFYIYPDHIHRIKNKQNSGEITHGQNYIKTINRLNHLERMGYNVVYIWERNFDQSLKH